MFLTSFFTAIAGAVRARNTYHDTIHALSRLSNRELNDLGIDRGDIYRVAAEHAFVQIDTAKGDKFRHTLVAKEA